MLPVPVLLLLFLHLAHQPLACTTIAAGRLATADGSVLVSQSDDGDGALDARLVAIPAADHPANATRPIFADGDGYPRYIGARAPPYYPTAADPTPTVASGSVPQIAHTHAYYEGDYGMLNSEGVGIGETSCSARILAPAAAPAGPLLPVEELTRLAMERTNTSRGAVQLMGAFAEQYGFFGVLRRPQTLAAVPNEGGESLMVGDAREAWVFHVLSDGTSSGAVWCAERVDDDKVAVVANMFTIRDVDLADKAGKRFLWSESMTRVAAAKGWWEEGAPFDFTKIYSYGEYYARGYSSRRMWRAFTLLDPALDLAPELSEPLFEKAVYPFAVTPAALITAQDAMALHRDYYQNTTYDLSQGLAAGPWGLPVRFNPEQAYNGAVKGNWERPMGSFRTGYTVVVQLRDFGCGGVLHFAPHTSLGSTFVPLFQGALITDPASAFLSSASPSLQTPGLDRADPRGVRKAGGRAAVVVRRQQRRGGQGGGGTRAGTGAVAGAGGFLALTDRVCTGRAGTPSTSPMRGSRTCTAKWRSASTSGSTRQPPRWLRWTRRRSRAHR
jgi:dipeptidase